MLNKSKEIMTQEEMYDVISTSYCFYITISAPQVCDVFIASINKKTEKFWKKQRSSHKTSTTKFHEKVEVQTPTIGCNSVCPNNDCINTA